MIDDYTTKSSNVCLEKHQQALAQVAEDNDSITKGATPPIADFLATEPYCNHAAQRAGTRNTEFKIDKNGLIVRVAPIDDAVQILIPRALWERLLYHSNHLVMAGHPGQHQMYDSMQGKFFWPHIANNLFSSCSACARNDTSSKLQREFSHRCSPQAVLSN